MSLLEYVQFIADRYSNIFLFQVYAKRLHLSAGQRLERKSSLILHARLLCIICTSLVFFAPLLLEAESNDTDKCLLVRPKSVMESF